MIHEKIQFFTFSILINPSYFFLEIQDSTSTFKAQSYLTWKYFGSGLETQWFTQLSCTGCQCTFILRPLFGRMDAKAVIWCWATLCIRWELIKSIQVQNKHLPLFDFLISNYSTDNDFFLVCRGDGLSQSRTNHKFLDMANALFHMGINWTLVPLYVWLQVRKFA